MSLQECVVPELVVTSSAQRGEAVQIVELSWAKLRCRVKVSPAPLGMRFDIRTKQGDPQSTLARPVKIDAEGKASVLVGDEDAYGLGVRAVVLDADGEAIATRATTVGGEET